VKFSPRSLSTRVAIMTALSVVVASTSVAVISQWIADRLAHASEDRTLSDAAETFALELTEPASNPVTAAADETRELAHAAIRIAVFEGDTLIAGDPKLTLVTPGTCRDVAVLRTCARPARNWIAVVARDQRLLHDQQRVLSFASALAVLLTSVLGVLAAMAIARVVTEPMDQLTQAVGRVPDQDPGSAALGPPSNLVEVDALRDTLQATFVRLGNALMQSRRFASDAAHELRTPLATLIGELELTAEQANSQSQAELAHALKLTRRMSTLLDRLLILARRRFGLESRSRATRRAMRPRWMEIARCSWRRSSMRSRTR
jgi:two-component system OmpR family sensor kinase